MFLAVVNYCRIFWCRTLYEFHTRFSILS